MLARDARRGAVEPNNIAGIVDNCIAADERAAARELTQLEVRALAASQSVAPENFGGCKALA